jgi:uncharacterized YigZ family protein
MENERFYRLLTPSEGEFRDRGSKFYALAFPVQTEEEVAMRLAEVKKKYYDARHHCTAYRLGEQGETIYTNDDGEPGNTGGPPILAAIRSAQLTDVFIVVVRYFGGIKLGVRGLIEAYRGAAEDAIVNGKIEEIIPKTTFVLDFEYPQTSEVNRILHRFETEEVTSSYTDRCQLTLAIRTVHFPQLQEMFERARLPLKVLD